MALADTVDADSLAILLSLFTGLIVLAICWFLFEILRGLIPRLYYHRWFLSRYPDTVDYNGERIYCHPLPQSRPFGWIYPTLVADIDSMQYTHSLDIVMFLRFMRTSFYMFLILFIGTAVFLMPVYATGQRKNLPPENAQYVTGVNVLSIANLAPGDTRLWATLVAEVIVTIIILSATYSDYKKFVVLRRRLKTRKIPANYSLVVTEIKGGPLSEAAVRDYFETIKPGCVAEVNNVLDCGTTQRKLNRYRKEVSALELIDYGVDQNAQKGKKYETPMEKVTNPVTGKKEKVDAADYHTKKRNRLQREVRQEQEERSPKIMRPTSSACVLFNSIVDTAIMSQVNIYKTTSSWIIHPGVDSGAVNWKKLCVSGSARKVVTVLGNLTIIFITLIWGLVIVSIQALENFSRLAQIPRLGFIQYFIDNWPPWLLTFLQGVVPSLVLMLLLKLIPPIFRQILLRQKIYALPLVEARMRNKFYVFLIFSNFIYVVVSGTILQQLAVIIADPSQFVTQIALGIPTQALFMMKYVLLNALIGYPSYVLDPGRIFFRYCWLFFAGKTERQIRGSDRFFANFFYFKFYALSMIVSLLANVYSTISPLINMFAAFYFMIGYFCCKFKLMYTCYHQYGPKGYWQYNGILHEGCFVGIIAATLIHQISMVVLFVLDEAVNQAIIEAVLFVATIFYVRISQHKFSNLAKTGSLFEVLQKAESPVVPNEYYGRYIHPGLEPPEPGPELHSAVPEYKQTLEKMRFSENKEAQVFPKEMLVYEEDDSYSDSSDENGGFSSMKTKLRRRKSKRKAKAG